MEKDLRKIKATVIGLALTVGLWFLIQTGGVILEIALPVIMGAFIACVFFALTDLYSGQLFLKNRKQSQNAKTLPVVAAIITVVAILVFLSVVVAPQLVSCGETLINNAPAAINLILSQPIVAKLLPADVQSQLLSIDWTASVNAENQALLGGLLSNKDSIANALSSVLNGARILTMSLLFAVLFITGRRRINQTLRTITLRNFHEEAQQSIFHAARTISICFKTYFAGMLIIALPSGILCLIVMLLLGLPYAPMISALFGVCALIPVFGGYIGAFLGAFMILSASVSKALIFLILALALQITGNMLGNKIFGKKIGMSTLLTMIAITIGGSVGGILGTLTALPVTAAIYHLLTDEPASDHSIS